MINKVKYQVVYFYNILFILSIKKNQYIIFLFKKNKIFYLFFISQKIITSYKKVKNK